MSSLTELLASENLTDYLMLAAGIFRESNKGFVDIDGCRILFAYSNGWNTFLVRIPFAFVTFFRCVFVSVSSSNTFAVV